MHNLVWNRFFLFSRFFFGKNNKKNSFFHAFYFSVFFNTIRHAISIDMRLSLGFQKLVKTRHDPILPSPQNGCGCSENRCYFYQCWYTVQRAGGIPTQVSLRFACCLCPFPFPMLWKVSSLTRPKWSAKWENRLIVFRGRLFVWCWGESCARESTP